MARRRAGIICKQIHHLNLKDISRVRCEAAGQKSLLARKSETCKLGRRISVHALPNLKKTDLKAIETPIPRPEDEMGLLRRDLSSLASSEGRFYCGRPQLSLTMPTTSLSGL